LWSGKTLYLECVFSSSSFSSIFLMFLFLWFSHLHGFLIGPLRGRYWCNTIKQLVTTSIHTTILPWVVVLQMHKYSVTVCIWGVSFSWWSHFRLCFSVLWQHSLEGAHKGYGQTLPPSSG
jgi:hypothetical protein